jgi:hypothetical protein
MGLLDFFCPESEWLRKMNEIRIEPLTFGHGQALLGLEESWLIGISRPTFNTPAMGSKKPWSFLRLANTLF